MKAKQRRNYEQSKMRNKMKQALVKYLETDRQLADHEYSSTSTNIRTRRAVKRKRGRRIIASERKRRLRVREDAVKGKKQGNMRIAYANVQGKTKTTRQEWKEIRELIKENDWDVIVLTETHRREEMARMRVPGYKIYEKRRTVMDKKGGGIAIKVKNSLQTYEWQNYGLEKERS